MLKPSPVPPNFLLSPRSPWTKGSKIFPSKSSRMPGPVSATSNSNMSCVGGPAGGEYVRSKLGLMFELLPESTFVPGNMTTEPPLLALPIFDCLERFDWIEGCRLPTIGTSDRYRIVNTTDPPDVNLIALFTRLMACFDVRWIHSCSKLLTHHLKYAVYIAIENHVFQTARASGPHGFTAFTRCEGRLLARDVRAIKFHTQVNL